MPAQIAKLTAEAETAQADYELCLDVYEFSGEKEKIRLVPHLTHFLMRRDENSSCTLPRAASAAEITELRCKPVARHALFFAISRCDFFHLEAVPFYEGDEARTLTGKASDNGGRRLERKLRQKGFFIFSESCKRESSASTS